MTIPLRNLALAWAVLGSFASLQAATITQTNINPASGVGWNTPSVWDGNPMNSDDDYVTAAGTGASTTSFSVKVGDNTTVWGFKGQLRDDAAGSTFGGKTLTFVADTRLLGKGNNGTTSTASWILQSGSHLIYAPNATGTATYAGTIAVSGNTAIGIQTNGTTTLNIDASLSGTGTLSLVNTGGNAANLNLNGDISLFTGTLLLSNGTGKGAGNGTFSIANSASFATLQLNWTSPNFRYNLSTNEVTFASLILTNSAGVNTVLGEGVYDATYLNSVTGSGIFSGVGSITVVPEPSQAALWVLGLLTVTVAVHRRKKREACS